jgi:hypothetical protein
MFINDLNINDNLAHLEMDDVEHVRGRRDPHVHLYCPDERSYLRLIVQLYLRPRRHVLMYQDEQGGSVQDHDGIEPYRTLSMGEGFVDKSLNGDG